MLDIICLCGGDQTPWPENTENTRFGFTSRLFYELRIFVAQLAYGVTANFVCWTRTRITSSLKLRTVKLYAECTELYGNSPYFLNHESHQASVGEFPISFSMISISGFLFPAPSWQLVRSVFLRTLKPFWNGWCTFSEYFWSRVFLTVIRMHYEENRFHGRLFVYRKQRIEYILQYRCAELFTFLF